MMKRDLHSLENRNFDLLVIGGGIYGACIAWDAASRGLSVALLEKGDFGHATSANSLKTIHGGLRYLQQIDLKRMRQSIQERATLMRIAPHLVHTLACVMPVYGHWGKGREVMSAALLLNDLISYDRNRGVHPQKHLPRGRMISASECKRLIPGIYEKDLSGAAVWHDAQVYNSERLTLSFVLSASRLGAVAANYIEVTGFLLEKDRVAGVQAQDNQSGEPLLVRAKTTVNAAGPWVDHLLGKLSGSPVLGVHLAKAINIATRPIFPEYAVGISARDPFLPGRTVSNLKDRLLFIAPWRGQSLIGTTYQLYDGDPDQFEVTEANILELVEAANRAYPPAELTLEDILFVYAGLVPISRKDPRTESFQREGKFRIRSHQKEGFPGLISVLGVKYTTARDVAEKVVDHVFLSKGGKAPPSKSDQVPLLGGDMERFDHFLEAEMSKRIYGLSPDVIRPLIFDYGTTYQDVLQSMERPGAGEKWPSEEQAVIQAQILHAVHHEMAIRLSDLVLRRTSWGTAGYPGADKLSFYAEVMGKALQWDASRRQQEIQDVERFYHHTSAFQRREKDYGASLAYPAL